MLVLVWFCVVTSILVLICNTLAVNVSITWHPCNCTLLNFRWRILHVLGERWFGQTCHHNWRATACLVLTWMLVLTLALAVVLVLVWSGVDTGILI